MILRVFDPTNERKAAGGKPAPRPVSLKGKTIGFISNGKEGTAGYFAHLDRMLREEFGVADIVFRRKSCRFKVPTTPTFWPASTITWTGRTATTCTPTFTAWIVRWAK